MINARQKETSIIWRKIMRLEVTVGTKEEFEKAIPRPSCGLEELGNYYRTILEKAASEKTETIHLQGLPKHESPAVDFQLIGIMEQEIMNFLKENEYPKQVRIICDSEETSTSYRMVYNFWFAQTKAERMMDEHWD